MTAPDVVTPASPRDPAIGTLLAGRYRVLDKLGDGGMGSVFRAENVVTGKVVAVKWLAARTSDAERRLLREAQATARVSHPNLVDIYDVIRDDEWLFLVMELLEGETLRAYLKRNPSPEIGEFIRLLLPALDGIAAAHAAGVIHRDLKPENIFLVRDGRDALPTAKVLDFGIAKFTHALGRSEADDGAIGTPLYMSAEQLRGDRDIDARADVYAVGVILYEAITGQPPHDAKTLADLVAEVFSKDPVPVALRRPGVPRALARAVDWAIARQREQRLPSIRALMRELEPFAFGDNTRAVAGAPAVVASAFHAPSRGRESAAPEDTEPELAQFVLPDMGVRRAVPRPWSKLGVIAAAMITVAAVGWWTSSFSSPDRRPPVRSSGPSAGVAGRSPIVPEAEPAAAAAEPAEHDKPSKLGREGQPTPVIAAPDLEPEPASTETQDSRAAQPPIRPPSAQPPDDAPAVQPKRPMQPSAQPPDDAPDVQPKRSKQRAASAPRAPRLSADEDLGF